MTSKKNLLLSGLCGIVVLGALGYLGNYYLQSRKPVELPPAPDVYTMVHKLNAKNEIEAAKLKYEERQSREELVAPIPQRPAPTYGMGKVGEVDLCDLDLSKPPTTQDLIRAGKLAGPLSPLRMVEPLEIKDEAERAKMEEINLSFGQAMQLWNYRKYDESLALMKEHIKNYPDSIWTGEAYLHLALFSRTFAFTDETQKYLDKARALSQPGEPVYQKAAMADASLAMAMAFYDVAVQKYAEALKTETDWRRKADASKKLFKLALYKKQSLAMRNCGNEALSHLLAKNGRTEEAKTLREAPTPTQYGYSLKELRDEARARAIEGRTCEAVSVAVEELEKLPMPFIAHYKNEHFVAVTEKLETGEFRVYDSQVHRERVMGENELLKMASGLALVFESDVPAIARLATEEEMTVVGGCYPPWPNDDDPPKPDPPCPPEGLPSWNIYQRSASLFVRDIPIWYGAAYGPSFRPLFIYSTMESYDQYSYVGRSWRLNYACYARVNPDDSVSLEIPNGSTRTFTKDGNAYISPARSAGLKLSTLPTGGFELEDSSGEIYRYSAAFGGSGEYLMSAVVDQFGNQLSISHDTNGRITQMQTADEKTFTFSYNAQGMLEKISDPFDREATFIYEESAQGGYNLVEQSDMGAVGYSYEYDEESGLISALNLPGNRRTEFSIELPDGGYAPDYPAIGDPMGQNCRILVTFPNGGIQEHYFCAARNITWIRDPLQYAQGSQYESVFDAPKRQWSLELDSGSQLTVVTAITEANGSTYYYQNHDPMTLLPGRIIDALGRSSYRTYNAAGNVLTESNYQGSSSAADYYKYVYQYAANGYDLIQKTYFDNISYPGGKVLMQLAYYTNENGMPTRILKTITNSAIGTATTLTYSSVGNVTQAVKQGEFLTQTTNLTYNTAGRLGTVALNGTTISSYTYNERGLVAVQTDANGLVTSYTYNDLNRQNRIDYADGKFETFVWDCCRLVSSTDRLGRTTFYDYDLMQNLVAVRRPASHTTHYGYDAAGNMTSLTDPAGNMTQWQYNNVYLPAKKIYADGGFVEMLYDGNGNMTRYTNARGQIITKGYDSFSRVTTVSAPDVAMSYRYDPLGRLLWTNDSTGTTTFSYNSGNMLLASVSVPISTNSRATFNYVYDEFGRAVMTSLSGGWSNQVGFDNLNRIVSTSNSLGTFNYGYASGKPLRLASVTAPNGMVTNYSYETEGLERLAQIQHLNATGGVISQFGYEYDDVSRITKWARNLGGVNSDYTFAYDDLDQLSQTRKIGEDLDEIERYVYDKAGNRIRVEKGGAESKGEFNNINQLLKLEAGTGKTQVAGRTNESVTVLVNNQKAKQYEGNYFEQNLDLPLGTNTISVKATDGSGNTATNRYTVSVSSASQTVSQYQYDPDGNLTDDGERVYAWDALCRLLSIEEKGNAQGKKKLEFTYNGLHQRMKIEAKSWTNSVWISDNAKSNVFMWDNTKIVQKRSIDGATVVRNYYEQGFTEDSTKYFYTKDHLGSVRELVENDGETVDAHLDYDAWGNILSEANGAGTGSATVYSDFSYTGHFRHPFVSQLVFAMYRAYAPELGRWMSRDSIKERSGTNLYTYVKNSPLNFFDPLGLWGDPGSAAIDSLMGLNVPGAPNSGSLGTGIFDFGGNKSGGNESRGILDGPKYGNYGGRNWTGGADGKQAPIDSSDEMYKEHDDCYSRCPQCPKNKRDACIEACNSQLVGNLKSLPADSTQWDRPPPAGMEKAAEQYRDWAIWWFK